MKLALTPWDTSGRLPLAEQAKWADDAGFHSFWLPESHFSGSTSLPAPLLLLSAIAARTRHIRLGTSSLLLPFRNAVQTAEEVAVLDQLSGGRVILGVGRGHQARMFRGFDIDVNRKREHFATVLQRMIDAWSGVPIALDDEGSPIMLSPLPVQRPHPPIWVAAFGPKALRQAATRGLPYLASPMESLSELQHNYRQYADVAATQNVALPDEVPVMRSVFVSDSTSECNQVRDALGGINDEDPAALVGDASRVYDLLQQHEEVLGMTLIVARTRFTGMSAPQAKRSLQRLTQIVNGL